LEERGGKSAALNYGVHVSRGEYVVFIDSDSTLDRDAIAHLLEEFRVSGVGAVSGNLGVRNSRVNLLTRLQAIEYLLTIPVGRWFTGSVGILAVIPGAFGAFKRELLERVGVHEPGPGNDSDLTIRILKLGARVVFAPEAICLTTVPVTWGAWVRQRLRWGRNVTRNRIRRHKDVFNITLAHFRVRNFISFVDTIFFGVVMAILWLVYAALILIEYPDRYALIFVAVFCMHLALRFAQFGVGLVVSDRRAELVSLIAYLPLFSVYRMVLKLIRIVATIQELVFRTSYRDEFAPAKVRGQVEVF
jgi:cellulose synthase/poly-beta-1,6-N-acetylglucosamine synthase-like glycosyltransferase